MKDKTHNMLFFMLDLKFNGFPLDFSFIGHEQGWSLLKNMIQDFYILCP